MNMDNLGGQARPESLDADAVCAQCNTVNTEGTLLCKVCGNNLRDQRMIRLAADQEMDLEHTGRRRRTWLSALFFVLAIVLIISTLINQELIVDWLINPGGAGGKANALWAGQESSILGPMADDLSAREISEESARAAWENGTATDRLEGDYALFADDVFVGSASAKLSGPDLYFVAILENGDQVRGWAVPQGNYYAATPETAAVRVRRGRTSGIRGVAMPRGGGLVECIGDFSNNQTSFIAYRLPDA